MYESGICYDIEQQDYHSSGRADKTKISHANLYFSVIPDEGWKMEVKNTTESKLFNQGSKPKIRLAQPIKKESQSNMENDEERKSTKDMEDEIGLNHTNLLMLAMIKANGKHLICRDFYKYYEDRFDYFVKLSKSKKKNNKSWQNSLRHSIHYQFIGAKKALDIFSTNIPKLEEIYEENKKDTGGKTSHAYGKY